MDDSSDSLISQPQGELALQTIAMPRDANMNGDIFGGWLVSQMDLAAAVLANKTAKGRVATVAIEHMVFIAPVNIGDVVSCYAQLIKIGRSSITMQVSAWSTSYVISDEKNKVADGIFVFVAIDESKRTRPVPQ